MRSCGRWSSFSRPLPWRLPCWAPCPAPGRFWPRCRSGWTPAFLRRAKRLLTTVLTEQTWEVDAVSGATYSSTGILNAVKLALSKAAAQTDPAEETPESLPADSGTGEAAASEPPAESVPAEPAESAPADPASPAGSEPAAPDAGADSQTEPEGGEAE